MSENSCVIGCYTLDLYCDNYFSNALTPVRDTVHGFQEFPHQYTGETFGQCVKQARAHGWIVNRDKSHALCPKCSGKR